jgi:hypothetical protein
MHAHLVQKIVPGICIDNIRHEIIHI